MAGRALSKNLRISFSTSGLGSVRQAFEWIARESKKSLNQLNADAEATAYRARRDLGRAATEQRRDIAEANRQIKARAKEASRAQYEAEKATIDANPNYQRYVKEQEHLDVLSKQYSGINHRIMAANNALKDFSGTTEGLAAIKMESDLEEREKDFRKMVAANRAYNKELRDTARTALRSRQRSERDAINTDSAVVEMRRLNDALTVAKKSFGGLDAQVATAQLNLDKFKKTAAGMEAVKKIFDYETKRKDLQATQGALLNTPLMKDYVEALDALEVARRSFDKDAVKQMETYINEFANLPAVKADKTIEKYVQKIRNAHVELQRELADIEADPAVKQLRDLDAAVAKATKTFSKHSVEVQEATKARNDFASTPEGQRANKLLTEDEPALRRRQLEERRRFDEAYQMGRLPGMKSLTDPVLESMRETIAADPNVKKLRDLRKEVDLVGKTTFKTGEEFEKTQQKLKEFLDTPEGRDAVLADAASKRIRRELIDRDRAINAQYSAGKLPGMRQWDRKAYQVAKDAPALQSNQELIARMQGGGQRGKDAFEELRLRQKEASSWKNLTGVIKGAALAYAGYMAVDAAWRSAASYIQLTKQMAAFQALTGSVAGATGVLQISGKVANEASQSIMETLEASRVLLSTGSTGDSLPNELRTLAAVAAGSAQPINQLATIWGEIRTKSQIYREDVLQFSRRGIPVMDELVKIYGVSREELNAMITDGVVGFAAFQMAMENLTREGGRFGSTLETLGDSVAGQMQKMGNEVTELGWNFGRYIVEWSSNVLGAFLMVFDPADVATYFGVLEQGANKVEKPLERVVELLNSINTLFDYINGKAPLIEEFTEEGREKQLVKRIKVLGERMKANNGGTQDERDEMAEARAELQTIRASIKAKQDRLKVDALDKQTEAPWTDLNTAMEKLIEKAREDLLKLQLGDSELAKAQRQLEMADAAHAAAIKLINDNAGIGPEAKAAAIAEQDAKLAAAQAKNKEVVAAIEATNALKRQQEAEQQAADEQARNNQQLADAQQQLIEALQNKAKEFDQELNPEKWFQEQVEGVLGKAAFLGPEATANALASVLGEGRRRLPGVADEQDSSFSSISGDVKTIVDAFQSRIVGPSPEKAKEESDREKQLEELQTANKWLKDLADTPLEDVANELARKIGKYIEEINARAG